jgi:ABC-type molybdate transport system substrate-binding protein
LPKKFVYWSLSLWSALMSNACHAELLRIAVASNFSETMKALKPLFESQSVHKLALSIGSSGKHYAQIVNGAPYDAFFFRQTNAALNKSKKRERVFPGRVSHMRQGGLFCGRLSQICASKMAKCCAPVNLNVWRSPIQG